MFRYFGPLSASQQLARAEADDLAADVADRPHQPPAEAVDGAPAALLGEAGEEQLLVGEALAAQVAGEVVPALGAVADAEVRGGGLVETALGEELAARVGLGADVELLHVVLRGDLAGALTRRIRSPRWWDGLYPPSS